MKKQKPSKPKIKDVFKKGLIFPPAEDNLPLIALSRPHAYVTIARLMGLVFRYVKLYAIYAYHSIRR